MWRGIGGREFGFGLRDGGVGLVRVRNHSHPTVSWVERVLFWAGLAWLGVGVWSVWGNGLGGYASFFSLVFLPLELNVRS